MKQRIILAGFVVLFVIFFMGLTGCSEPVPTNLSEYAGVWSLQDSFLSTEAMSGEEPTTAYYLVINYNETGEIWTNRGCEEIFSIEPGTGGLMEWIRTQTPRNSSWDGSRFNVTFNKDGEQLSGVFYPDDHSWSWKPVFDKVSVLPVFSYNNDFEDGSLDLIMLSHISDSTDEWEIITDPDDSLNKILSPVHEDGNSDLDIKIRPGKNYTIEFDIKRLIMANATESCWMAIDFDIYMD